MACIKNKKGSPYWWIKFRDEHGQVREESTHLRWDLAQDTRKAKALKAQKTAEELGRKPARANSTARWESWLPDFMKVRYAGREKTLISYTTRWSPLSIFMHEHGISEPQLLRRDHAIQYMNWRQRGDKDTHVRPAHHNTARMELKFLSLVMTEAILREYAPKNPLHPLNIPKIPSREKPEMTDAEIFLTRQALKQEPDWMAVAFEVALYTGCRLSETNVVLDDVDLEKKTILFREPKGKKGSGKGYAVPLREELVPLFQKLKRERKEPGARAYEARPPEGASKWWTPARAFHRLFKKTKGLGHLCFHCLRVTFITRGARGGTSMAKMMRLVNHATELIHRIYQRLNVEDLKEASDKIALPAAA